MLAAAAREAREHGRGFWPHDKTHEGIAWAGAPSLPEINPIFPKLWRRLEKYTQDRDFRDESDTLESFIGYLEAKRDRLVIISQSRATDLDNLVNVEGTKISFPIAPEDVFFMS